MNERKASLDEMKAEDWAGDMGDRWLQNVDRFESMLSPIGVALLQQANYMPRQRVIDIGCGGGVSSLAIAKDVGPEGSVVGIDISPALIAECERRALRKGINTVRFIAADAATLQLEDAPFDQLDFNLWSGEQAIGVMMGAVAWLVSARRV